MPTSIPIWTNTLFPEAAQQRLLAGLGPHRLIVSQQRAGILSAAAVDPALAEAEIAFGQPDPDQLLQPSKLKWVHLTTAGYTRYDRADLRAALMSRKVKLTNSSSVFDEPCAEHVLGFMLAGARAFPGCFANQGRRGWDTDNLRRQSRLLRGERVLMVGFGAIARRLVELLAPLGMEARALRRTPTGSEPVPAREIGKLLEELPAADHVVDILPASESTRGIFGRREFAAMKRGAIFYNIGRGTTVDQPALVEALNSGHLGGAFLDVTDPEPLPKDDPLWSAANCLITPHTGGGSADEFSRVIDHFLANLRRYESGSPLRDEVI
jgi:phosphoglycerate dehydrogenase-like enzyme